MKRYYIETITGKTHSFTGKHLPEREKPNWHYYETNTGTIFHFRKEHMVSVEEGSIELCVPHTKPDDMETKEVCLNETQHKRN